MQKLTLGFGRCQTAVATYLRNYQRPHTVLFLFFLHPALVIAEVFPPLERNIPLFSFDTTEMAAFKDPQKLADAIALAQSFKSGQFSEKRDRKSKARVEAIDIADSSEIHRDRTWHTRQQLVAGMCNWQIILTCLS